MKGPLYVMPSGEWLDSHHSQPARYYIVRIRDGSIILVSLFAIAGNAATRQFGISGRLLTTASVSVHLLH
jgi:hypothetical protein